MYDKYEHISQNDLKRLNLIKAAEKDLNSARKFDSRELQDGN